MRVLRTAVAAAALVAVSAVSAEAQMMGGMKVEEIRLDMVGFATNDFGTSFGVNFPGTVTLAMYLNDNIALEPMVGINSFTPDGGDAVTTISLGLFVPYYLAGDRGMNGLFVAPGFTFSKTTDVDGVTAIGADLGLKKTWKEKISWRAAVQIRSNDGNTTLGVVGGVGMFWR